MVEYSAEWCIREDKTKWCKRMGREKGGLGAYMGTPACYRPHDRTICFGREVICTMWYYYNEEEAVRILSDIVCHEEDHKAIHEVTKSAKLALTFDTLFNYPFDFEANRDYFRHGAFSIWGKTGELSSYGKMINKKYNIK